MNILQVTLRRYPEVMGGVDMMVATLVPALKRLNCTITVFVPGSWSDRRLKCYVADGVTVYSRRLTMPFARRRRLRNLLVWLFEGPVALLGLWALCRRHRINLVHIHTATPNLVYFRMLRLLGGPPYVVTFHRGDVVEFGQRPRINQKFIKWGLAGAASTNAVSKWLAREAKGTFQGLCDPVAIYNGIDVDSLISDANRLGDGPSESRGAYFLMVGSFDPYKGHETAIRAWGEVVESNPNLRLLLAGEGDLRKSYERLIERTSCQRHVVLLGQRRHSEILSLMASALGLIFPSRSEGFAYVILEAGLMENPVICTDIPAFAEVVADGESGIIVPVDDPKAIADAVMRLMDNEELRKRLGSALRERVEECFCADLMAQRYETLYRAVIGNDTATAPTPSSPPPATTSTSSLDD